MLLIRGAVIVSIYATFLFNPSGSVRIYFSKCGSGGFACKTITNNGTKTLAVSLTCPTNDITIFINQFGSPSNIQSLEITDCLNLTISFRCADNRPSFQSITIKNISILKIDTRQFTSLPPNSIHLENISYIENIPSFTFSQNDRLECSWLKPDIKKISFENVTIGTIQSNALKMATKCENFSLRGVKVNRVQTSAIVVKLDNGAEFVVENSEFEVVEHLAFRITGAKVSFRDNKFIDISSSGINGTIKNFTFALNFVNTLQSYGISILCTNAIIIQNTFEYLKSNALEKISPGLLEESGVSFGKLKFLYEFKENTINYMDAGCLHPDYLAYENVATDMVIEKNVMLCTCFNIRWIFPGIGHGHNTKNFDTFYQLILDKDNENVCFSSCNLPLFLASQVFKEGKCPDNDSPDLICSKVTNPIPTAPTPNIIIPATRFPNLLAKSSKLKNSSVKKNPLYLFLLFSIICAVRV